MPLPSAAANVRRIQPGLTASAYLSNNKLYVTQAEILTKLIIGRFAFEPQANGNLSLIYNG